MYRYPPLSPSSAICRLSPNARAIKVGKEQIVGLLAALTRFAGEGDAARNQRFATIAATLVNALGQLPGARVRTIEDLGHGATPLVEITVARGANGPSAATVAERLRKATPAIHVDGTNADAGILLLVPTCLAIDDAPIIGSAFAKAMTA